jgi:isopentenyldiphosphate isomerase
METRWATYPEVAGQIAETPETYAPWFRIYMERFPNFEM